MSINHLHTPLTIHDLPLMVIDNILHLAAPRDGPPLHLSHACRHWSDLCRDPSFWRNISTGSSIKITELALTRSATQSLNVFILNNGRDHPHRLRRMVETIKQEIHRIESIECLAFGNELEYACRGIKFSHASAPRLRDLRVEFFEDNALLRAMKRVRAPALERAVVDTVGESSPLLFRLLTGAHLRCLSLTELNDITIPELHEHLSACPHLQDLSLSRGDFASAPLDSAHPTRLSELTYLSVTLQPVDLADFLDGLELPALEGTLIRPCVNEEDDSVLRHTLCLQEDRVQHLLASILRTIAVPLHLRQCTRINFREALTFHGAGTMLRFAGHTSDTCIVHIAFDSHYWRKSGLLECAREIMYQIVACHPTVQTIDFMVPTVAFRTGWTIKRRYPAYPRSKFAKKEGDALAAMLESGSRDASGVPLPLLTSISLSCVSDALQPSTMQAISASLKFFRDKAGHDIEFNLAIQELRRSLKDSDSEVGWVDTPPNEEDARNWEVWPQPEVTESDFMEPPRPDLRPLYVPGVHLSVAWIR
ncbi:unnamed protein product [Peniophora sp. CBMAI 1063]|nr:unnamed protein product [Peniophora sp. CBMAI 1063]